MRRINYRNFPVDAVTDRCNYSRPNVHEIKHKQTKRSEITPQVETAAANSWLRAARLLAPVILLINSLALFLTS